MKRLIEVLVTGITDNEGIPLDSGTVTTYEAGTTTLKTIFSDFALTQPLANPAALDFAGRVVAYSDSRLKIVIQDSAGTLIHTWDNVGTEDSDIAQAAVQASLPVGAMLPYGGDSAPDGYLLCDGSPFIISVYSGLYGVIGTKFNTGGEPAGTARLPGTARKTLVGAGGSGTATLGNAVGNTGGEETHLLITGEMPTHNHALTDPGHHHALTQLWERAPLEGASGSDINASTGSVSADTTDSATTGITLANTGGGAVHNNLQPSLVTNFIIKY